MKKIVKIFLKACISGNLWQKVGKEMDKFFKPLVRVLKGLLAHYFKVEDKKIIFKVHKSRPYSCNVRYIYEKAVEELSGEGYSFIWAVNDKKEYTKVKAYVGENARVLIDKSWAFFKEYASARWIVVNYNWRFYPKIKKNQKRIQTWHGSLGIKKFGLVYSGNNQNRREYGTFATANYYQSNSIFENSEFTQSFGAKPPFFMCGHARNDLFFYPKKVIEARKRVNNFLKIKDDVGIILYAPTFRQIISKKTVRDYDESVDVMNIDVDKVLKAMQKRYPSKKWIFALRFHPILYTVNSTDKIRFLLERPNIYDLAEYPEAQDILARADVVITDYSSLIYDTLLTPNIGFLYATDYEEYDKERGLFFPLEEAPFPFALDDDTLAYNIEHFDEQLFAEKRAAFLKRMGCIEDGHASERIVALIRSVNEQKPISTFLPEGVRESYKEFEKRIDWEQN